jgi:hypothetical protein
MRAVVSQQTIIHFSAEMGMLIIASSYIREPNEQLRRYNVLVTGCLT